MLYSLLQRRRLTTTIRRSIGCRVYLTATTRHSARNRVYVIATKPHSIDNSATRSPRRGSRVARRLPDHHDRHSARDDVYSLATVWHSIGRDGLLGRTSTTFHSHLCDIARLNRAFLRGGRVCDCHDTAFTWRRQFTRSPRRGSRHATDLRECYNAAFDEQRSVLDSTYGTSITPGRIGSAERIQSAAQRPAAKLRRPNRSGKHSSRF
jgi:hypothetical protein